MNIGQYKQDFSPDIFAKKILIIIEKANPKEISAAK